MALNQYCFRLVLDDSNQSLPFDNLMKEMMAWAGLGGGGGRQHFGQAHAFHITKILKRVILHTKCILYI